MIESGVEEGEMMNGIRYVAGIKWGGKKTMVGVICGEGIHDMDNVEREVKGR